MSLKKYQLKRKFARTPEPKGEIKKTEGDRFVVHRHEARQLHYDFRLELDGVLKSWAVPKGVPKEKGIKHLAVQVEDHPVDYIDFQGTIPEGNYGAGTVEIWDCGKYNLIEKTPKAIKFELFGKKLKGNYILFKFKDKNWLIFKM